MGRNVFLNHELSKVFPLEECIGFWIGILGKKQDFTVNDVAIEVKTTKSGDPNVIKISSMEQLEQITPKLYLTHLHINDASESSGLSLEDLFETCKANLDRNTGLQSEFINKASKLYSKASEEQLHKKMHLLEYEVYEVTEDFPKITPNHHKGISAAKYSINPSYIKDHLVSKNIDELL